MVMVAKETLPTILFLSLLRPSTTLYMPCGSAKCSGAVLASHYKYYSEPPPNVIDNDPNLEFWPNCSAVLGPDHLVVYPAQHWDTRVSVAPVDQPLDWSGKYGRRDLWNDHREVMKVNRNNIMKKAPDMSAPEKWPECKAVLDFITCMSVIAPHSGTPNIYATQHRSGCRDVCNAVWDACGENPQGYFQQLMDCRRRDGKDLNRTTEFDIEVFPPAGRPTACFTMQGHVMLADCSATMPFKCQNGGTWHPECTGCLCPPGFGGSDCSRCSSDYEMWPGVWRMPSSTTEVQEACQSITGGPLQDEVFDEDGKSFAVKSRSDTCHETRSLALLRDEDAAGAMLYDCALETLDFPMSLFKGGYARAQIDVRPRDLEAYTGSVKLHLVRSFHIWRPRDGKDPILLDCNMTQCGSGPVEECLDNHAPKDYYLCIKCKHISCVCPETSAYGTTQSGDKTCFFANFGPDIVRPGTSLPTYWACGETYCSIYMSVLPFPIKHDLCGTSACSFSSQIERLERTVTKVERTVTRNVTVLRSSCSGVNGSFIYESDSTFSGLTAAGEGTTNNTSGATYFDVEAGRNCTLVGVTVEVNETVLEEEVQYMGTGEITEEAAGGFARVGDFARDPDTDPETQWRLTVALLCGNMIVAALGFINATWWKRVRSDGGGEIVAENPIPMSVDAVSHRTVEGSDVGYAYSVGRDFVIRGVTCKFSSADGGVAAIVGPSGAGKTTLLDVIAGRKEGHGFVEGEFRVHCGNDADRGDAPVLGSGARRALFGYVMQDETLAPCLTVTETLRFAANLRVPGTQRLRSAVVQNVIKQLGLSHVAHSRVGSVSRRGISGGERKRVSIGIEIVVDPPALLLDEPTTGLDAASAASVMGVLRSLVVERRRAVLCTLHQPRSDIFAALGNVLLLGRGGKLIYSGHPSHLSARLAVLGHACPPGFNVADFAMDCIESMSDGELRIAASNAPDVSSAELRTNPGAETDGDASASRNFDGTLARDAIMDEAETHDVHDNGGGVATARATKSSLQRTSAVLDPDFPAIAVPKKTRYSANALKQFVLLFERATLQLFRNPTLLVLHYIVPIFVGIGFGVVYRDITPDISGIQNYVGGFFALQVFWCLIGMTALDTWNVERLGVSRELASGLYQVAPYFLACAANDIIMLRILPPALFSLMYTILSGVATVPSDPDAVSRASAMNMSLAEADPGAGNFDISVFAEFATIVILTSTSFSTICLTVGAIVRSTRAANAVATMVMVFSLLFGGLLINKAVVVLADVWYSDFFFITPLSYAYEALLILVLKRAEIEFNPKGFDVSVQTDGSVWLANFGMNPANYTHDINMLVAFSVGGFILAGACLLLSHHNPLEAFAYGVLARLKHATPPAAASLRVRHSEVAPSNEPDPTHTFTSLRNGGETSGHMVALDANARAVDDAENGGNLVLNQHQICHTLRFQNLTVKTQGGKKIVEDVSGFASTADGGVFAILGPSGAGKTTTLDVIAGRKNTGRVSGTVHIDGSLPIESMEERRARFSYVMQDETLVPVLSVRESLEYSATLRLRGVSRDEIRSLVNRTISSLSLDRIADNRIGSISRRGISGGERKRVSIGMELVIEPPAMLLDEPTTGLDAASAASVMGVLRSLVAMRQHLVICTIHQPRSDIFHGLGRVLVLGHKGDVVYFGRPRDLTAYLSRFGHFCPPSFNVADFALDVISKSIVGRRDESAENSLPSWDSNVDELVVPALRVSGDGANSVHFTVRKASLFSLATEMYVLLWLECIKIRRGGSAVALNAIVAVITGVFFGSIYRDLQPDVNGVWNRLFALFSMVTFLALLGTTSIGAWQEDRTRFLRERAAGYYGTLPYVASKLFVDALAMRAVPCLLFALASYSTIGWSQRYDSDDIRDEGFLERTGCTGGLTVVSALESCDGDNATYFGADRGEFNRSLNFHILSLFLVSITSSSLASIVGVATRSPQVANFVSVLLLLVFVMFSGALVSQNAMPLLGRIMTRLSPFAHLLEIMSISHFGNQCFVFNPKTVNSMFGDDATEGDKTSIVCTEVPGYKWLLQFGCTWTANTTGYCRFDDHAVARDLNITTIFILSYVLLVVVVALVLRERR